MQKILPRIGIDHIEISRFGPFAAQPDHHFLRKAYSPAELAYCFHFADPAPHLAGIFAAKEACSKALGAREHPFIELEIKHTPSGAPEVWKNGARLEVSVSISHSYQTAIAVAIV